MLKGPVPLHNIHFPDPLPMFPLAADAGPAGDLPQGSTGPPFPRWRGGSGRQEVASCAPPCFSPAAELLEKKKCIK